MKGFAFFAWSSLVIAFLATGEAPNPDPEISNTDYSLLDSYIRDSPLAKADACKALKDGKLECVKEEIERECEGA